MATTKASTVASGIKGAKDVVDIGNGVKKFFMKDSPVVGILNSKPVEVVTKSAIEEPEKTANNIAIFGFELCKKVVFPITCGTAGAVLGGYGTGMIGAGVGCIFGPAGAVVGSIVGESIGTVSCGMGASYLGKIALRKIEHSKNTKNVEPTKIVENQEV